MRTYAELPPDTRPDRRVVRATMATLATAGLLVLASGACSSGRGTAPPPQLTVAPPLATTPLPVDPPETPRVPSAGLTLRVRVTDDRGTRVTTMAIDDYVVGAVRAELPPKALQGDVLGRLLEVQAIISRTYALANLHRHESEGFDLCDSTHCQLYRTKVRTETDTDPAARAVASTSGQVVTYGGRVIQALFHSSCGGHTTSAGAVWGGKDVPYLRPVPDWFCARHASAPWEFATDEASLRRALNDDPRTSPGARLNRVDIVERDASGRAVLVSLAGSRSPIVRAEEFRTVLRRAFGQRSIRSTWFNVTRDGQRFVFTGVGFGHGVGLCQAGASQRAQAGQSPADIIAHYFPGTRLQAASVAVLLADPASQHLGH